MRHFLCATLAALPLLASQADAQQVEFDYITFDSIRLDPTFALQTSTRWGILVNTGTVPISLEDDWERGLCYAESSAELGAFFYEPLNPFGAGLILQPGEAVGDAHPLLLAQLQPGETFVTNALIASFQFGVPFPDQDFHIDVLAQIDDRIAKTRTTVELADLGGTAFWTPMSAERVNAELSPVGWSSYGNACTTFPTEPTLIPHGDNSGSGPPWIAYRSSMPQIGNWNFGFEIESPLAGQSFLLGISQTTGSLFIQNCEVLIGLLPPLQLLPGQIPFFQEVKRVPIPDNPALIGLTFYAQGLVLSGTPMLTRGVEITLGDVAP